MGLFLPGENRSGYFCDHELAEKIGNNAAVILGIMISEIEHNLCAHDMNYWRDDRWWMRASVRSLAEYSCLGVHTVTRTTAYLRKKGLIISHQYDLSAGNCENWYSVDGERLAAVLGGNV